MVEQSVTEPKAAEGVCWLFELPWALWCVDQSSSHPSVCTLRFHGILVPLPSNTLPQTEVMSFESVFRIWFVTAVRPAVTLHSSTDVAIRPAVTLQASTDVAIRPAVTLHARTDVAIRPAVTLHASTDVAIRPAVTLHASTDVAIRPAVTLYASTDVAIRPAVTLRVRTDVARCNTSCKNWCGH